MESVNQPSDQASRREQQYDRFVALLTRCDQTIRQFIRFLLPCRDGIDDIMQETALECWKKFSSFQPVSEENAAGEFVRWACVIARYKVLSWQRDKSRDRLVFRDAIIDQLSEAASEALDEREERRQAIATCLEELPPDHRRLVLSVHSPGESVARIAQESGEQARRLYNRINAFRKLLLKCVERRLAGEVGHG